MGEQFFWFYDILIAGTFLGVAYKCTRQGFASSAAGFVGILLSFAAALGLSAGLSEYAYENWIGPGISEKINYSVNDGHVKSTFDSLRTIDMSKAKISGKNLSEINLNPDNAGKVTLDLTNVDLSATGLEKSDLSFFRIDSNMFFFGKIDLGKVNISASELAETDIGTIILSRTLSATLAKSSDGVYDQLSGIMENVIPGFSKASEGSTDLVAKLIANIIKTDSATLEEAINDNLVKPVLIIPVRALIFSIIFAIISVVCSILAKSLRLVNSIPVVGKLNTFLGALLGVVEAAVAVFMVCIGVGLLISLTGDNITFLNTPTVNETKLFKHIYFLDFLKF
ncbi:MAG: CvpA family protein [Oscillospiraceae bacterium]|jgi:uncharacterized membrane protein required for colicin V production|nr:CvpA family protein [Oscillospiraceae bacterium]